jgi:hypothetical protein
MIQFSAETGVAAKLSRGLLYKCGGAHCAMERHTCCNTGFIHRRVNEASLGVLGASSLSEAMYRLGAVSLAPTPLKKCMYRQQGLFCSGCKLFLLAWFQPAKCRGATNGIGRPRFCWSVEFLHPRSSDFISHCGMFRFPGT